MILGMKYEVGNGNDIDNFDFSNVLHIVPIDNNKRATDEDDIEHIHCKDIDRCHLDS